MVCLACLLPIFLIHVVNSLPILFDFLMVSRKSPTTPRLCIVSRTERVSTAIGAPHVGSRVRRPLLSNRHIEDAVPWDQGTLQLAGGVEVGEERKEAKLKAMQGRLDLCCAAMKAAKLSGPVKKRDSSALTGRRTKMSRALRYRDLRSEEQDIAQSSADYYKGERDQKQSRLAGGTSYETESIAKPAALPAKPFSREGVYEVVMEDVYIIWGRTWTCPRTFNAH